MEMTQARVDSFFDVFGNLPQLPFIATEKDDPTEMRAVPLGLGVIFAKYDIQSAEQILGRIYPTVTEAIVAVDPSFTADPSLAARTIASRTKFALQDSPPIVSTFSPHDRTTLLGYRQIGYRGISRLEFTRFGNGNEIVGLFRTGTDHEASWEIPCLGIPAHHHEYLIEALGLDRMNIDQKDFFIMFIQIGEEQARIESRRLRQELHRLRHP